MIVVVVELFLGLDGVFGLVFFEECSDEWFEVVL